MAYQGSGTGLEAGVCAAAGRGAGAPGRRARGTPSGWSPSTTALRDYIAAARRPPAPAAHSGLVEQARGRPAAPRAAPALRRAIDLLKRRGLLILVSDLYDEGRERRGGIAAGDPDRPRGRGVSRAGPRRGRAAVRRRRRARGSRDRATGDHECRGAAGLSRGVRARFSSAGAPPAPATASTTTGSPPTCRSTPRCAITCGAGPGATTDDRLAGPGRARRARAASSLPVVVHLLRTHRARRILFPTLRFIAPSRTVGGQAPAALGHLLLLVVRIGDRRRGRAGDGAASAGHARAGDGLERPPRPRGGRRRERRRCGWPTASGTRPAEVGEADRRGRDRAALTRDQDRRPSALTDGLTRAAAWLATAPPARREIVVHLDVQGRSARRSGDRAGAGRHRAAPGAGRRARAIRARLTGVSRRSPRRAATERRRTVQLTGREDRVSRAA